MQGVVHNLKAVVHKLNERARKAIFLAYSDQIEGYKLMSTETNQIVASRYVKFDELNNVLPETEELEVALVSAIEPRKSLLQPGTRAIGVLGYQYPH